MSTLKFEDAVVPLDVKVKKVNLEALEKSGCIKGKSLRIDNLLVQILHSTNSVVSKEMRFVYVFLLAQLLLNFYFLWKVLHPGVHP